MSWAALSMVATGSLPITVTGKAVSICCVAWRGVAWRGVDVDCLEMRQIFLKEKYIFIFLHENNIKIKKS
jgi:hypothetical protein